ncbi:hypothetical protein WJ60_27060 [Burkholderia ubonensis]|nr:hypothetical protein WJ60_27060 [Burkholderia ubonensis]
MTLPDKADDVIVTNNFDAFLTARQIGALDGDDNARQQADDAALQEAINRSRASYAFEALERAHFEHAAADLCYPGGGLPSERPNATSTSPESSAFLQTLERLGLEEVSSPGDGNNCAIYSLVNLIHPEFDPTRRKLYVDAIREELMRRCPQVKRNQPLYLDADEKREGVAAHLLAIVHDHYNVNAQLYVAYGDSDGNPIMIGPITKDGPLRNDQERRKGEDTFTHSLVIWDQGGHFVAVRARAGHSS